MGTASSETQTGLRRVQAGRKQADFPAVPSIDSGPGVLSVPTFLLGPSYSPAKTLRSMARELPVARPAWSPDKLQGAALSTAAAAVVKG